jgi:hypothetical protein
VTAGPNPSGQPVPEGQFQPGPAPQPNETPTTPLHQVAPGGTAEPPEQPVPVAPAVQTSMRNEQCPSCGAYMALDQRYCLECGNRRGDPRLPFMDAVVFMDSVRQPRGAAAAPPPPPPQKQRSRMSANASLIAGVATLVLAIGVGVLIGRTGESGSSGAANTPTVLRVEGGGGGGGESTAPESSGESSTGGGAKSGKSAKKSAKAKASTGSSGTSKATEEVFKPKKGVKLPPPTVKKGGQCQEGTAGCNGGKFEGNFFE